MAAASDAIVTGVKRGRAASADAQESIRAFALGMLEAIDAHPWVGAALTQAPDRPPVVRILDAVGQDVRALGVPRNREWAATMALFNYIGGVGSQNAANAQIARAGAGPRRSVGFARQHLVRS